MTTSFFLDEQSHRILNDLARRTERNQSQIVRYLLKRAEHDPTLAGIKEGEKSPTGAPGGPGVVGEPSAPMVPE